MIESTSYSQTQNSIYQSKEIHTLNLDKTQMTNKQPLPKFILQKKKILKISLERKSVKLKNKLKEK